MYCITLFDTTSTTTCDDPTYAQRCDSGIGMSGCVKTNSTCCGWEGDAPGLYVTCLSGTTCTHTGNGFGPYMQAHCDVEMRKVCFASS
jgi:hypothetical protein